MMATMKEMGYETDEEEEEEYMEDVESAQQAEPAGTKPKPVARPSKPRWRRREGFARHMTLAAIACIILSFCAAAVLLFALSPDVSGSIRRRLRL
jgi:type VI protein secretion system component VasF